MSRVPLRLGFVSVIRPAFRGASVAAAEASLAGLAALGRELDFTTVVPALPSEERTAAGAPLPSFAVHDAASAQLAALQLSDQDLDFLLVQHTTFATGEVLTPLLQASERVGMWALPEGAQGGDGQGPLPLNSLCGLNMTLSYLDSPHVNKRQPVRWYYGAVNSDWFVSRLASTVAALRGLTALANARVLQIGGVAPGFYGLEEELGLSGPTVHAAPLSQLLERVAAVNAAEAAALAAQQAQAEPADVNREQLERSARIELALTALACEGDYDALAVRCWPEVPDVCGSMACAAMGNLAAGDPAGGPAGGATPGAVGDPVSAPGRLPRPGVPAACEGDVAGALSMLALQAMSGRSAVLMDLSDVDEAADELLFWHCGNAPREWAAGGASRLTTHFNRTGLGTVRDMVLAPGPVTGFRLVGQAEALVMSGTFGAPERASYDGVRGWLGDLRWNGRRLGARAFVTNVLDLGLAHHFAFGRGDLTAALRELCEWLGRRPVAAAEDGGNELT